MHGGDAEIEKAFWSALRTLEARASKLFAAFTGSKVFDDLALKQRLGEIGAFRLIRRADPMLRRPADGDPSPQ